MRTGQPACPSSDIACWCSAGGAHPRHNRNERVRDDRAAFLEEGALDAGNHPNVIKAGGWIGFAPAAAAWYASFAAVVKATFARTLMPVMPMEEVASETDH